MFLKLKLSIKDLVVGFLIVSPLILIVISSFHPVERNLEKQDEETKATINALARAAILHQKTKGYFPLNPVSLNSEGTIDWIPENADSYVFQNNGTDFIIYATAHSLAWREYCSGETTNIVYSFKDDRTDLVCGDTLTLEDLKFVN